MLSSSHFLSTERIRDFKHLEPGGYMMNVPSENLVKIIKLFDDSAGL